MTDQNSQKTFLNELFEAALAAADPYYAVKKAVRVEGDYLIAAGKSFNLGSFNSVIILGAGKATARMALATEELLDGRITSGLIIVKEGYTCLLEKIQQIEAAHPVPDESGVNGTRKIQDLARGADEKTLIICLLSGGASSLLVAPAAGLALADKQNVTGLLLKSGATIAELNTVRKHLSAVKGGQLALAACRAQMLTLILSDVIGDRTEVIASGPTVADDSSFAEAWDVIERYKIRNRLPEAVLQHLQAGLSGNIPGTVKADDPCLSGKESQIVGSIGIALEAAAQKSIELGIPAVIIKKDLQGEARDVGSGLAQQAMDKMKQLIPGGKQCLLYGGETTVTVSGNGIGGRNQELALAFAAAIRGLKGVTLLSCGTDGSDGPTNAAGALVDGATAGIAEKCGLKPDEYLERNDSWTFFHKLDQETGLNYHLVTGPTGTNVMDLQILLIEKPDIN